MKKFTFGLILAAALVILPGASVWEGAAAISADFPETGLYIATNSFPRNTVIDLTNLETGKTVRVIVAAGLDTPGLLALVSREAAEVVGLRSRAIGRIRLVAPTDPIAFSRFSDDFRSGDPDFDPQAAVEKVYGTVPSGSDYPLRSEPESAWSDTTVAAVPVPPAVIAEKPPATENKPSGSGASAKDTLPRPEDTNSFIDEPETSYAVAAVPFSREPVLTDLPEDTVPAPAATVVPEPGYTPPSSEPSVPMEYTYTLIPAEERPPQGVYVPPSPAVSAVPQIFTVPAVSELERGKYYLQLGAYTVAGTVEQELSKVGRGYPLTVQSIVLSGKPVYRVLIGPVSQGEAGALLKQFKAKGYKDAFVRRAN